MREERGQIRKEEVEEGKRRRNECKHKHTQTYTTSYKQTHNQTYHLTPSQLTLSPYITRLTPLTSDSTLTKYPLDHLMRIQGPVVDPRHNYEAIEEEEKRVYG